jgi:hypothetical protein
MTTQIFLRHIKRSNIDSFNNRIPRIKRFASSSSFRRRPVPPSKSSGATLIAIRWDQYKIQDNNSVLTPSSFSVPSPYDNLSDVLSTWLTKIPKGFENFFPKQKEGTTAGESVSSSETESTSTAGKKISENSKTKHATFKTKDEDGGKDKKKKKKRQKRYSEIPPPGDNDPQNIPAMIALLLLVTAANGFLKSNDDGNEGGRNGGEITFVDFRNHLLDSGQVDKIVVVNNNLARVILYPGSKGAPHNNHDTLSSSSSSSSAGDSRSNHSRRDGGHAADNTILEFNKSSSTSNTIESSSSASESLDSSSSTGNNTPVYHFYIGSVESFEEKLSKAQSDVHPREWVPVQYVNEVNLLQEFIKVTPMLALGAILFYYSRGIMGGGAAGGAAGGGGGMGGIFQVGKFLLNRRVFYMSVCVRVCTSYTKSNDSFLVYKNYTALPLSFSLHRLGKSNAKKVNPETVKINFDDVAGCTAAKQEVMEFVQFLSKPE